MKIAWIKRAMMGLALTSLVVVAVPAAAQAAAPVIPGAASCVNPHCYSRAVDQRGAMTGVRMTMPNSWFSMLDQNSPGYRTPVVDHRCGSDVCPWFINREVWLGNSNTGWVEVGIRNGYQSPRMKFADGRPGCGCQAYFTYWEDGPGDAYSHTHLIANVAPDNSVHTYQIESAGVKKFRISIDGREVGISRPGFAAALQTAIGSEVSGLSTVQPLSYMNMSCQSGWAFKLPALPWRYIYTPSNGVRSTGTYTGKPSQTYFGGWNDKTHQLCIGKGGL